MPRPLKANCYLGMLLVLQKAYPDMGSRLNSQIVRIATIPTIGR